MKYILFQKKSMWALEMSRARDGQSIGEFRQVTRVVDSYSLGRIHRIALLDKEWCLGEKLSSIYISPFITILWKTRELLVFVRKPPRSDIRTAFSLSTLGRIFGCKSTFPFPFLCPMIMADATFLIYCVSFMLLHLKLGCNSLGFSRVFMASIVWLAMAMLSHPLLPAH